MKRHVALVFPAVLVICAGCGGAHDPAGESIHRTRLGTDPLPDPLSLVTIDCGDGDPLHLTVDADTVGKLQETVQAMVDNPIGVVCSLSTSAVPPPPLTLDSAAPPPPPAPTVDPAPSTATTPTTAATGTLRMGGMGSIGYSSEEEDHYRFPFVVGSGRYQAFVVLGGCLLHFHVKARMTPRGFKGIQIVKMAENQPPDAPSFCTPGEAKANVTCLSVADNIAEIRGVIFEATGFFEGLANETLITDVTDNGRRSCGAPPDKILQVTDGSAGSESSCTASPGVESVQGNITVRPRGSSDDD
jgi:hypothetical protein